MAPNAPDERFRGLAYALAAYGAWGLLPVYFKALAAVPPIEVLAHRIFWSVLLLAALIAVRGGPGTFRASFRRDRLPLLALTTLLIATNWLVYIWAVQAGRILEASLGYFVNPLVNVVLGVVFLGESLSRRQRGAVLLAALGVVVLVARAGTFPWIAMVLALSFGFYGLLRKKTGTEALGGLFAETSLLAPVALAFLVARQQSGQGAFGSSPGITVLLAAAGAITALPLVWFTIGVHRLRLSTMGLVQYVAPSGQFLLAVLLYREPFGPGQAVAFACIWCSLAIYSWDALARNRAPGPAAGAGPGS